MATATAPTSRKDTVLMEALVAERWLMLTLDTDVDNPERTGETEVSAWYSDTELKLAYALARLSGDGWEGAVDTRAVVVRLMETIGDELRKAAVAFRLGLSDECVPESVA